jgi:serine/threonine-protein kinase
MNFSSALTIKNLIGQRGFGDVYEGLDEVHGKVAVKVLRRQPFETESEWQARRNDLSEAQNLREARHKNVVAVLHVVRSQNDGSLHMVTEFCEGGSLEGLYKAGPINISKVRKIVTDICLGLDALHARRMLHRDIKPGNILFSGSRWKIGDFGLVTNDVMLGYASAQGYLDHLAPEVHKDQVTSVKTDVWALGMTIYRLLHGEQFYNELIL